jgi:cytochrome P450 family 142 subfamily A polypeptide 1
MRRTLLQDFEMHGRTMREGDQVIMLYPAGNFDERVYEDPDTFNIQRSFQKRPALSFGWGKHYCLGASLARLEIKVVLEQLLVRMPHIQLDASNPPVRKQSSFLRGLMTLPAVYPAAQRAVAK